MPAIVGAELHEVSAIEWEGSGEAFEVGAWGPVLVAPVSSRHGDWHILFPCVRRLLVCVESEEDEVNRI